MRIPVIATNYDSFIFHSIHKLKYVKTVKHNSTNVEPNCFFHFVGVFEIDQGISLRSF